MKSALVLSVVSADALVSASIHTLGQLANAIEMTILVQEMLMVTIAVVSNNSQIRAFLRNQYATLLDQLATSINFWPVHGIPKLSMTCNSHYQNQQSGYMVMLYLLSAMRDELSPFLLFLTIFSSFCSPFNSNLGQGDCCDGRCRCREDGNGYRYRHNGTTENCACPPREVICNFQVSMKQFKFILHHTLIVFLHAHCTVAVHSIFYPIIFIILVQHHLIA